MTIKHTLLAASLAACTSLIGHTALANGSTINQLVFFGDSLSDDGNLYNHDLHILPKSPPYYKGRFSNGLNWADDVSDYFANKNHTVFQNYAVGGATTFFHNPFAGYLPVTVREEMDDYFVRDLGKDKSHSLFFIWSGGNDYLSGDKKVDEDTTKVVNTTIGDIDALVKAGAKNVMVFDLPDLGGTPHAIQAGTVQNLHELSMDHNAKLITAVTSYQQQHPDVELQLFDVYDMFHLAVTDTEAFNKKYNTHLTVVDQACWPGGYTLKSAKQIHYQLVHNNFAQANSQKLDFLSESIAHSPDLYAAFEAGENANSGLEPCTNPAQHIFWDTIHPTTTIHALLAKEVEQTVEQHYQFEQ